MISVGFVSSGTLNELAYATDDDANTVRIDDATSLFAVVPYNSHVDDRGRIATNSNRPKTKSHKTVSCGK
jgi:hypothetical protein